MKRSFLIFLISFSSCIDPYTPSEIANSTPVLIVDGFINLSEASKITLSYSQNLNDIAQPAYAAGADVWIEDELGNEFLLTGDNLGNYYLAPNIASISTYRLKIKLPNQKEYESEFVPALISPAIDSITWGINNAEEIEIKVSTHNSLNEEPSYYRWTFDETWEYYTPYFSTLVFDYTAMSLEPRQDNISKCWRKGYSTDISIESTTRFKENRISEFVIDRIKLNSERCRVKYSLLAKQQSLTEDAYNYWKQVKKTNEDLGTLFGPLPSEVIGNIRCVSNPEERVIGFFSVSSISTERIFITTQELPRPTQPFETRYTSCELFQIPVQRVSEVNPTVYLFVDPISSPSGESIIAYTYSTNFCVDCRFTGGTNVQPEYWK